MTDMDKEACPDDGHIWTGDYITLDVPNKTGFCISTRSGCPCEGMYCSRVSDPNINSDSMFANLYNKLV